ncbi:hypothetical protein SY91_02666 [Burkholderia cenocepacia]|nr:hypothetical protein SY91_02666 [Burkholderia cenocepacia]
MKKPAQAGFFIFAEARTISRRRPDRAREQHLGETEAREIGDPHRIQLADQMIVLMLNHARMEPLGDAIDLLAELVEAAVAHLRVAADDAAHARHRQAAFPALFHLRRQVLDLRVDQHGLRHRRRIRVAVVVAEAEDDDLKPDADLRRGEPRAVRVVHRLEHIRDDLVQLGCIEPLDRLGDFEQARIAHLQDLANHGVLPSRSWCRPSSSSTGMPSSSAFASLLPASAPATT